MSSYKNNKDGTLTPIATNLRIDNQPTEQYVTEDELEEKVPNAPTTDGTYKLQVSVSSGTPTYSWVADT